MAVKHTMIISANMTAYSTAVGPSSETRKRCTFKARFFMASPNFRREAGPHLRPRRRAKTQWHPLRYVHNGFYWKPRSGPVDVKLRRLRKLEEFPRLFWVRL